MFSPLLRPSFHLPKLYLTGNRRLETLLRNYEHVWGEVLDLRSIVQSYEITSILGISDAHARMRNAKKNRRRYIDGTKGTDGKRVNRYSSPFTLKMEIGSGESIEGRPIFQDCLRDLENGAFQAIAVKEITRLSRGSYSDAGRIVNLLQSRRLLIITPYKVYDPRNPADMRQIRFELFMAREEFEMTRERMTGAKYTYAAQGKWISGMAPYGYTLNKNNPSWKRLMKTRKSSD